MRMPASRHSLMNALVMGAASTFVLVGSSFLVSVFRHVIPKQVRISCFIIIIATFVTTVDFVLAALMPAAHKQLGAFISLIVVNCLILGRQEAFASKNPVGLAVADAFGIELPEAAEPYYARVQALWRRSKLGGRSRLLVADLSLDPETREVKRGEVLCIVEAMKLMNEIESDVSGKVVKLLVDNATPVEYNQPLFLIELD